MTIDEFRRRLVTQQCTHLFVDLDDTLLQGDSLPGFCRFLLARYWYQPRFHYLVSIPLVLAASRVRPPASFKPSLARFFKGWTRGALEQLGSEFAASKALPRLRPGFELLLANARERQIHTVLATASLDIYCQPLARGWLIDSLLSTEIGFEVDNCTGTLRTPNCKGEDKLSRVRAFCDQHAIEPRSCAFLSDHESDIPCFEFVGFPAVVSPTKPLAIFARAHGIPEIEV